MTSPIAFTVLSDPELAVLLAGHEAQHNIDRPWSLQVADDIRHPLRDLSRRVTAAHVRQTTVSLHRPDR